MTGKPVQHKASGWTRRRLLAAAVATGAYLVPLAGRARLTPAQAEGPFYPATPPADSDADLTRVEGRSGIAEGRPVFVSGRVVDRDGNPVAGARVDVWQANHFGRYRHPRDRSDAPLDPNFQGFGQIVTGADGEYGFLTIEPGPYAASRSWQRPPHIHFKLRGAGFQELTTQMYFRGHPLNDGDRILQALSSTEQQQVVIPFVPGPDGIPAGRFDIGVRTRA